MREDRPVKAEQLHENAQSSVKSRDLGHSRVTSGGTDVNTAVAITTASDTTTCKVPDIDLSLFSLPIFR